MRRRQTVGQYVEPGSPPPPVVEFAIPEWPGRALNRPTASVTVHAHTQTDALSQARRELDKWFGEGVRYSITGTFASSHISDMMNNVQVWEFTVTAEQSRGAE
jgi:hypothetical protein